jgi:SAM-dependent methyltransferase
MSDLRPTYGPEGPYSAVAALAIARYTEPHGLIVDLGCGAGSTLVEAIRADRLAIGIERNSRLAREAREAVVRATALGGPGFAAVVVGELADVPELVGPDSLGKVSLVLVDLARAGVLGTHGRPDAPGVLDRFSEALHAARRLLRPDGHVVIAAREQDRFCWSLADLLSELGAELDFRVVEPDGSAVRDAFCRVRCAAAGSSEVVVLQLVRSGEGAELATRHEFAAVGA